jgi:hypothetical protein
MQNRHFFLSGQSRAASKYFVSGCVFSRPRRVGVGRLRRAGDEGERERERERGYSALLSSR